MAQSADPKPTQPRMYTQPDQWSIQRICDDYTAPSADGYKYEDTQVRVPGHQRLWGWTGKKGQRLQQELIDSILKGYPIPAPVLSYSRDANKNDHYDIEDGRHRIETIQAFRNDKFAVPVDENETSVMKRFSELDERTQERYLNTTIPVIIARNATPSTLATLFQRLNNCVVLSDSDRIWAAQSEPFIVDVLQMIKRHRSRIQEIMGIDYEVKTNALRKDIVHWTALAVGAQLKDAKKMIPAFVQLEPYIHQRFNEDGRVDTFLSTVLNLYNRVQTDVPGIKLNVKRELRKVGKYTSIFADDLFETLASTSEVCDPHDNAKATVEATETVLQRWTKVLTYEHSKTEDQASLMEIAGTARATHERKIKHVRGRINIWEKTGKVERDYESM